MKSLVELLEVLLSDCGSKCDVQTVRDAKTLRDRVEHEGDGFITITLPKFCQDFERSLDEGRIGPGAFASFGKLASGIPAWLQGFLSNVFDQEGRLLTDPSVDCIRAVRQTCLFGKKIEKECSHERLQDAIDGYVQCEEEVLVTLPDCQISRWFRLVAATVAESLDLGDFDLLREVTPKHGPGATEESITGNRKWIFRRWHSRLEAVGFTHRAWALGGVPIAEPSHDFDGVAMPDLLDPEDERPVKVVFVPKTQKTPRVIAVEPVCMQFTQQALSRILVQRMEQSVLTGGHVNFRDQSVNQGLALSSSGNGSHATLDMKEASDRVSLSHVDEVFAAYPEFREMLRATRSTSARLPDGRVIGLRKFASMGSALCFPVESLCFFIAVVASRLLRAGQFPTTRSVHALGRDVYVFGDDLIVPADEASAISGDLELLGFKVNRRKSFWTGKFRESCGMDAYDGVEVTPVYLRCGAPTESKDASRIVSLVSTANHLYEGGYVGTAAAIRKAVEALTGPLPRVRPGSLPTKGRGLKAAWRKLASSPSGTPAIGWYFGCSGPELPRRRCRRKPTGGDPGYDYQRFEYKCLVAVTPREPDPLEGVPALVKCLYKLRERSLAALGKCRTSLDTVVEDVLHLDSRPRPYSLTLKRRWVSDPRD